jgi:hypothetical protein
MEIENLLEMINDAFNREYRDDHLSDKERQALVDTYVEHFKDDEYIMRDYPITASMTEQYLHIVYSL